MKRRSITICLGTLLLALLANETSCSKTLNTPKNGMLIMNNAKTVAVAFCPIGQFLVKDNQPRIFPLRFVYADGGWVTEPVDPSGGKLVPIPDCIPIKSSMSTTNNLEAVAEFFQYRGDCQSKEVQEAMKMRVLLLGTCSNTSCAEPFIVTCG